MNCASATVTLFFCGCVWSAGSLAGPQESVERLEVQRADDSYIVGYLEKPSDEARRSLLVVLQGSNCESVAVGGGDRLDFAMPEGMVRLDIEKYAISESSQGGHDKVCPDDYLLENTIHQRVFDVLTMVASLRSSAPWWNGRLYLMGTSEGATIASLAGPLLPETSGIVLINGSIGRPFRDGWADAMAASVAAGGGSQDDQQAARTEATATWERVRKNPTPQEQAFGNGNTFKWWDSIIDLRPSNTLVLTSAPILVLQSEFDEMTPASAGKAVKEQFEKLGKSNLTYVELPGLTHGLRTRDGEPGWEPVMAQMTAWLTNADTKHPQPR